MFRQPTHTREYSLGFSGVIPEGYGAGKVTLERSEPAEVLEANDNHVRFNLYTKRTPEQFLLKRMGTQRWYLRNITPSRNVQKWQKLVSRDRPGMKETDISKIDPANPSQIMQPKIDGAHGILVLEAKKPVRVFSYREAKNETGLIEHSHKMPMFQDTRVPSELDGTVLRGEIFAVGPDGRALPTEQIGGLLNSNVWRSRRSQEQQGARLAVRTFGVDRFKGKDVSSKPYAEQLAMLQEVADSMRPLQPVPTAFTARDKKKMLDEILAGGDPLTQEGVVLRDADSGQILKAKQRPDFDVFVRGVLPGEHKGHAGALQYSRTPKGKIVGNVGIGFTHQQRADFLRHPERYIGRAMKIRSQGQYGTGSIRVPVFREWHLDKGRQPVVEDMDKSGAGILEQGEPAASPPSIVSPPSVRPNLWPRTLLRDRYRQQPDAVILDEAPVGDGGHPREGTYP